jgi:hypothetical protein
VGHAEADVHIVLPGMEVRSAAKCVVDSVRAAAVVLHGGSPAPEFVNVRITAAVFLERQHLRANVRQRPPAVSLPQK